MNKGMDRDQALAILNKISALQSDIASIKDSQSSIAEGLVITQQPVDYQAQEGDTQATFTVVAKNAKNYYWMARQSPNTSWYVIPRNSEATLVISLTTAVTRTYRCLVIGNSGDVIYTDNVTAIAYTPEPEPEPEG